MRSRTLRRRRPERQRRAARWAAALATATLASAGLAGAGPADVAAADVDGYEVVAHNSTLSSNITRGTTAECTGDNELIGMGAQITPTQTEVLLESIVPDLTDESVEVFARESATGTGNDWRVQAIAICADPGEVRGRYLATDEETVASANAESASALADCDPGDRTLSAGFEYSDSAGRVHLTTLLPTLDSAMAVGQEDQAGTTTRWSVEAIALCADVSDSDMFWDETASVSTSSGRTHWSECPTDYRVTGSGGFAWDESAASGTQNIYAVRPSAFNGLDYAVVSSNEPSPGTTDLSTLYGYVICLDLD
jgi:hypothetical protein